MTYTHTPHAFVEQCKNLAYDLAHKMFRNYRGIGEQTGQALDEFISAALFGLAKAANGFDPSRGYKPTTYAWPAIQRELLLARNAMQHPGLSGCKSKCPDEVPGVALFGSFENGGGCESQVPEPTAVEDDGDLLERQELAHALIGRIKDVRDRRIVWLRYVDGLTLEEIGKKVKLTKERIRQRINKAIRRMQENELKRDRKNKKGVAA